ncbi:MAG: hypothetical protein E7335_05170 [Clostridiales bacterium]|nr:hypothetical protein [Clostridiales bacterium]
MKNRILSAIYVFLITMEIFCVFVLSMLFVLLDESVSAVIGTLGWCTVYLLLPMGVFAAAILLKFGKGMGFLKAFFAVQACIVVYAAAAFGTQAWVNRYLSDFTPEKWVRYPSQRICMIADMAEEYELIGMTKEDIWALFGAEDIPYADVGEADILEYYIGASGLSIDPTMMTIVFEENRAVEVYCYTEHRSLKHPVQ